MADMQITPLSQISVADFPKEQQKWLPLLLQPINQFLQSVTTAMQGNLDFKNNFLGQTQNLNFTFSTTTLPIKFAVTMTGTPQSLVCVSATQGTTPIVLLPAWKLLNGNIYITDIALVVGGVTSLPVVGTAYSMQVRLET